MRLIVARCSATYSGRLDTLLPEALRLIMVKADGSVLLHADSGGYKPLNWMTPPTVIEEQGEPLERIVVRKHAGKTEDRLEITLTEVLSDVMHDMGAARTRTRVWPRTESRHICRSCWPSSRTGAARGCGWCGVNGRPTSARSI